MSTRARLDQTSVARLLPARKFSFPSPSLGVIATASALTFLLSSCTSDALLDLSWESAGDLRTDSAASEDRPTTQPVQDLDVAVATESAITVRWTQVADGTGAPAQYRVRYSLPEIEWTTATQACVQIGDQIGAQTQCTIEGLEAGTTYDIQLMSLGVKGEVWEGGMSSNVAKGKTKLRDTPEEESEEEPVVERAVSDLAVMAVTSGTFDVQWTQVDDGTGAPARYRVKYAEPSIRYGSATIGCDLHGTEIGAAMSCTIQDLEAETTYDVQLMSYRSVDGKWQDAVYSNIAQATTATPSSSDSEFSRGLWLDPATIAALPTSGSAWDNVLNQANGSCGSVDLSDQTQSNNVCILAKALVFARTGITTYRSDVVSAIREIVNAPAYNGTALSLGRELAAYVLAADVIDLSGYNATLDQTFRLELRSLLTTATSGAARNLVDCHERRPNNWGTMCGATRVAVAIYLDDVSELDRAAQVFKGYLGDRSAHAGFKFGGPEDDLSWQCDPTRPVAINPAGCTRYGRDLGGILPDDQRRGGSYTWPPPRENYVWEALQGAVVQATLLERAGYPAFEWEDRALLRAVQWLHTELGYEAEGDDGWQPHLFNHYYATSFAAPVPARYGKNMGWTDWTHR